MFRRSPITPNLSLLRGAPPRLRRDKKSVPVVHMSQRPAFPADIDFSSLGLQFPPIHNSAKITSFGWSQKPENTPDYPFTASLFTTSLPQLTHPL